MKHSASFHRGAVVTAAIAAMLAGAGYLALSSWPVSVPVRSRAQSQIKAAPLSVQQVRVVPPLPATIAGTPTSQPLLVIENVQQALDPSLDYRVRISFINHLGTGLNAAEQTALLDYLQYPAQEGVLTPSQQRALANDIINVLRNQHAPDPRLTGVLVQIYDNPQTDPVMRDYAIQHLSEWRWKVARLKAVDLPSLDQTIWAAAAQSQQSFSGTALLALLRNAEDSEMPDYDPAKAISQRARIGALARTVALDQTANLPARLSALSVYGRAGGPGTATTALQLAQNEQSPVFRIVAMRVAAQASMQDPSTSSEVKRYLTEQANAGDSRLGAAASEGLTLMNVR